MFASVVQEFSQLKWVAEGETESLKHKGLDMCTVALFLKEWWYVYFEFGELAEFCKFAEFDDLA